MALIKVSEELIKDEENFNLIVESFDTIEEVEKNEHLRYRVLRVQNEEVTKEDKVICPEFIRFEGVRPFAISWDI